MSISTLVGGSVIEADGAAVEVACASRPRRVTSVNVPGRHHYAPRPAPTVTIGKPIVTSGWALNDGPMTA